RHRHDGEGPKQYLQATRWAGPVPAPIDAGVYVCIPIEVEIKPAAARIGILRVVKPSMSRSITWHLITTIKHAVNHVLRPRGLGARGPCLSASDVCTARALRPEITRHQPVRAITSDPCWQYEVAPPGYCRTAPANSKTVTGGWTALGSDPTLSATFRI